MIKLVFWISQWSNGKLSVSHTWLAEDEMLQTERGSGEPQVVLSWLWHHSPLENNSPWGPRLGHLNVRGGSNVKWSLWHCENRLWSQVAWIQIQTPPLTGWVSLGKFFHFSDTHFSHLQNGCDNSSYVIWLLWGLIELSHKVHFGTLYLLTTT